MDQFKTMSDLREYVKGLGKFCARPTIQGEHPTLYLDDKQGKMIHGIREKDYLFSNCHKWVKPHDQMGLSFSAHWQHLKDKLKMKKRHARGKALNVYWVLESSELAEGLEFVPDRRDKQHYLLVVTQQMTVYQLSAKLTWVADRMSEIRDAGKVL